MSTLGGFRAPPHATRPKGDDSILLKCTLVGRDVLSTQCPCWGGGWPPALSRSPADGRGPQKGQTFSIPLCSALLPAAAPSGENLRVSKHLSKEKHYFSAALRLRQVSADIQRWHLLWSSPSSPAVSPPAKSHCNSGKHPKLRLFIYRPAPGGHIPVPSSPCFCFGPGDRRFGAFTHPCAGLLWGLHRLPQTLAEEPQTLGGHFGVRCLAMQSNFGVF